MALIKDAIEYGKQEKKAIAEKIETEFINPSKDEQEAAAQIIREISEEFAEKLRDLNPDDLREEISRAVSEKCSGLDISFEDQKRIEKTALTTAFGQGPIEKYIEDPEVTEIVVQRYDNIVIEKGGSTFKTEATFYSEEHLRTTIERIMQASGRQINLTYPVEDARLPDGSRVNATIPPVSPDGATLTIRKFSTKMLSAKDYVDIGAISEKMIYFLERCVKGKISMFISGGTGSGKTTLLNTLSGFIPNDELIVTIEDVCELKLQQPNVRRMETRVSRNAEMMVVDQQALVRAALRQRPDRIILGETRDGSIVDLISAMSTGHEGSISTIHANSPRNLCDVRVPILYSMNKNADFTERSIAMQFAEAIQLVVQISRLPDKSRKIVNISTIEGVDDNGRVIVKDIFYYDRSEKKFVCTGYVPKALCEKIAEHGYSVNENIFLKG